MKSHLLKKELFPNLGQRLCEFCGEALWGGGSFTGTDVQKIWKGLLSILALDMFLVLVSGKNSMTSEVKQQPPKLKRRPLEQFAMSSAVVGSTQYPGVGNDKILQKTLQGACVVKSVTSLHVSLVSVAANEVKMIRGWAVINEQINPD